MSKLLCDCGHVIVDQTDDLPYKAEFIPAQLEEEIFTALEPAIIDENSMESIAGRVSWVYASRSRSMYQCENCGRILLQRGKKNSFASFVPEDAHGRGILAAHVPDTDGE